MLVPHLTLEGEIGVPSRYDRSSCRPGVLRQQSRISVYRLTPSEPTLSLSGLCLRTFRSGQWEGTMISGMGLAGESSTLSADTAEVRVGMRTRMSKHPQLPCRSEDVYLSNGTKEQDLELSSLQPHFFYMDTCLKLSLQDPLLGHKQGCTSLKSPCYCPRMLSDPCLVSG
jgi:hypothetical protein